jgi:hypothetical protein
MPPTANYYDWAFKAITDMLTANLGLFVGLGQNLFRALATIMLAWFGIKTALGAGELYAGMHFSRFASLVLTISFGFAMVNYYASPIPGIGMDFHHLITDQAQFLSNAISTNMIDTITNKISAFEGTIEPPGVTLQFWAYFDYWTIILLLSLAQAIAMVVAAFGIIATAVCVLLGPVFIPFFIVPQLDWLFWGWLRCFIQYAFYQVVAAAVIFIIANILTGFMNLYDGRPIPVSQQAALLPAVFIVIVASVYALLKVPMLTSHIFSGSSGGSAAGLFNLSNPM